MAMGASLEICNQTGDVMRITSIDPMNSCSTWAFYPPIGQNVPHTESCLVAMGNASTVITPLGVGCDCQFKCDSNGQAGAIFMDLPAVGGIGFKYGNPAIFNYEVSNPRGNSYVVVVSVKK
jgi:hypothetical protein